MLNLFVCSVLLAPLPGDAELILREVGMPLAYLLPMTLPSQYLPDRVMIDEIRKHPEKYPIRIAVLEAGDALRGSFKLKPVQEIREANVELAKKYIIDVQEDIASSIYVLKEELTKLEKASIQRKTEPHLRWQAHLDFLLAEIKFRIGTLEELNLIYGRVHRNELPAVDKDSKHTGWKLGPAEKMISKSEIRRMVEEAQEEFEAIKKKYDGTPWAKLAERELAAKPGLEWISAEIKPPPPPPDPRRRRP